MLVERVSYNVNWKSFKRGASFFIPCLNPRDSRKELLRTMKRLGFQVITKVVVEDGIRGLRIWRV